MRNHDGINDEVKDLVNPLYERRHLKPENWFETAKEVNLSINFATYHKVWIGFPVIIISSIGIHFRVNPCSPHFCDLERLEEGLKC